MSTHVCLISKQPIGNLVPLLMEKPARAIFLISEQMQQEADWLKAQVQPRGIQVNYLKIDPYGFTTVSQMVNEIINTNPEGLVLNATGGTKITALAAFQSFYFAEDSPKIIYLDTAHDRLLQLAPQEQETSIPDDLIQVGEYLGSYGKQIKASEPVRNSSNKKKGLHRLCALMTTTDNIMGQFNSIMSKHSNKTYATVSLAELGEAGEQLMDILEQCEAGQRTRDGIFNIPSSEKLSFCHGGWLEEYVAETVRDLGLKGVKPLQNVEISWNDHKNRPTTNELDVLFCHRNRLHIISCKTANLDQNTEFSTKGKEALYELDSLADQTGGLFGKTMLCSVRELNKYSLARAKLLHIQVIHGRELLDLSTKLKMWIT